MLNRVRIVLSRTSHPGNIGAAARAMKNMGLKNLYLVAPKKFPSEEAIALAGGAEDILMNTEVVGTLEEALAGASLVLGASARVRRILWPTMTAREAGIKVITELKNPEQTIAIVFGSEQSGLLNEELQKCHAQLFIPADPEYLSLNLAQAVQIISYEIQMAWLEREELPTSGEKEGLATALEMEGFYTHLEKTLQDIQFLDPDSPGQLMSRLRRLYNRARPDKIELNIVRGILTAIQKRV